MGFLNALPGAVGQGLIWGVMAIGVYITFRVLDFADLTVDGTLATGGAAMVMSLIAGCNVYLALLIAFVAGCLSLIHISEPTRLSHASRMPSSA